jgi:hypothetical protein
VSEWNELKCSRYRFWPAEQMLRTFLSGSTPWLRVGKVSIYEVNQTIEAMAI